MYDLIVMNFADLSLYSTKSANKCNRQVHTHTHSNGEADSDKDNLPNRLTLKNIYILLVRFIDMLFLLCKYNMAAVQRKMALMQCKNVLH